MADWTLSTASGIRVHRSPHGSPFIRYFQASTCASTATIKNGQIVGRDTVVSTGGFRVSRAPFLGGGATNLLMTSDVIGVASEADTSDGSTTGLSDPDTRKIGVFVADGATEFLGYIKAGASASSFIGQNKAVLYDSTLNIYTIDSTNSTAALATVHITGVPQGTVGDTNGPLTFKFLSTNVSGAVGV